MILNWCCIQFRNSLNAWFLSWIEGNLTVISFTVSLIWCETWFTSTGMSGTEPFKYSGFMLISDSPQWLTETNSFKLTVSLFRLWYGFIKYCTCSESRQPIRFFSNKREVCFYNLKHVSSVSCPSHRLVSLHQLHHIQLHVWVTDFLSAICWGRVKKKAWAVLTLLAGVGLCCCHLHIIGGQQAYDPVGVSFPPVRVGFIQDVDQLTLGEAQLVAVGCGVVVHSDNLAHWGIRRTRGGCSSTLTGRMFHKMTSRACWCGPSPGRGEGEDLVLEGPRSLTWEEWNQPLCRFLPRAWRNKQRRSTSSCSWVLKLDRVTFFVWLDFAVWCLILLHQFFITPPPLTATFSWWSHYDVELFTASSTRIVATVYSSLFCFLKTESCKVQLALN